MTAAIKLTDVSKKLDKFKIEKLSLTVPQGLVTGFIGPNGAGKSTTIRLIMDVLKPDAGEISLFGKPHINAELKQDIGFVYDSLYLYEDFTIKNAKMMIAPLYHSWDEELFQKYLTKFELPLNKKFKKFSQGMRMKTSLLFGLSHRPRLIIMDEPTSGLDPIMRRELLEDLQEFMIDEEQTIFFSTHITTDLDKIADHVVFIDDGGIVLQQSMTEIRDDFYVVKGSTEQLDADLKALLKGYRSTSHGFTGLMQGGRDLFRGVAEFHTEPASLEDIMYYMTRKECV